VLRAPAALLDRKELLVLLYAALWPTLAPSVMMGFGLPLVTPIALHALLVPTVT